MPRRPKPTKRVCAREACDRGATPGHKTCSYLCTVVHDLQERTERQCKAIGPGYISTEAWTTVVELGDLLTRFYDLDRSMASHATKHLGFTPEQWSS